MALARVKGPRSNRPVTTSVCDSTEYHLGLPRTSVDSIESTSSQSTRSDESCLSLAESYASSSEESDYRCDYDNCCSLKRRAHIRRQCRRVDELRPLPSLPPSKSQIRPLPHPGLTQIWRKRRTLPKPPQLRVALDLDFPPVSPMTCTTPVYGWHAPIRYSHLIDAQINWDVLMDEILSNDSGSIMMDNLEDSSMDMASKNQL
ncbi:hypothetical protein D9758_001341 [Tetrapyrgos nigripes]|uniref:Uncharacterized protein n=1 Tax=Tetrapyrgos nigripes TaxID=182062 RepID=A0A8H5GRV1_9AGAR|nr:hypothetical protein D9758_001341 [Tetrapyrgos nigripes]